MVKTDLFRLGDRLKNSREVKEFLRNSDEFYFAKNSLGHIFIVVTLGSI